MARGRKSSSPKEMKRANGTGCIRKLSGNRRKPWQVLVTEKMYYNKELQKGVQKTKTLGTFETRLDAEQALKEFLGNPYVFETANITFENVYKLWSEKKYEKLSENTVSCYTAAYKYCEPIAKTKIKDLKTMHLQKVVDDCPQGSNTKSNIKVIMNGIFNYAEQNDMVSKNYARFVTFEYSEPTIERTVFSLNEIQLLKSLDSDWSVRILLILLYTGMRVNELLKMPRECCDFDNNWLDIKKAKNKFSIRKVPIHPAIKGYLQDFFDMNKEWLIVNQNGYHVTYNNFVARNFVAINQKLNSEHRLHDTRHTFISRARECNMDELCVKRIVGHTTSDVTSRVYTHIAPETLQTEMEKLCY